MLLLSSGRSGVSSSGSPGRSSSGSTAGGGTPRTIGAGLPFTGRSCKFQMLSIALCQPFLTKKIALVPGPTDGGGSRTDIYGSRAYGSGYYGGAYSSVGGRPFIFGYWPIYYGSGYYHDDEYGPADNASRAGGPQTLYTFTGPPSAPQDPHPQYGIYGDRDSVVDIWPELAASCQATLIGNSSQISIPNGTGPTLPDNTTTLPFINATQAIQYYRASSFVLFAYFDNVSTPATNDSSVPVPVPFNASSPADTIPRSNTMMFPASSVNGTFQSCINATIGNSLLIEDGLTSAGDRSVVLPSVVAVLGLLGVSGVGGKVVALAALLAWVSLVSCLV